MAYLESQDLIDELGDVKLVQLTAEPGATEIDPARVVKAIEFAKGTFDSYVKTRYSIPVPVTPLVKTINLDLAIFQIFKSRTSVTAGVYTVRENAYKAALQLLKDIQSGKAALDVPAAEATITNPANSDKILTNSARSKFSDDKLSSF
jgi:phage gp36-like protein